MDESEIRIVEKEHADNRWTVTAGGLGASMGNLERDEATLVSRAMNLVVQQVGRAERAALARQTAIPPGPLVHPKWARAMASAGAAMCAGAQALPTPWDVGLFVVGWCVAYAGGAQLQQPEWLKGRRVVELAAVPVLMALGGLAGAVAVWKPHLREVMGAVAVVCAVLAGKARQEAVVLPPGLKSLALALLAAGALQGCATTRMLAEAPPEDVPHALAPGLTADVSAEERAKECKHVYWWLFATGIAEDVAATFAGGATGGAVLTEGDSQRWFAVGGLGFIAIAKATGSAHANLAARYAEICRKK